MPTVLQSLVTGSHTGAINQSILTDASANFVRDGVQSGDTVYNLTDGSSATITGVTTTTITGTLAGGAENDWDTNDTYRLWATEPYQIRIKVFDTLHFPMSCEVVVANPQGATTGRYTDYKKIRIREWNTSQILFYGRVERADPQFDDLYGQVIKIYGRDNLQELLKRLMTGEFTNAAPSARASERRSELIKQIVEEFSYTDGATPNIDTSVLAKFANSVRVEGANILDMDFTGAGKNALRAIYEIAQEDPWNATPTGYGFDYYLDTTMSATALPTPQMWYFQRGALPVGGPVASGLTIAYGVTETDQRRSMFADYLFSNTPKERATLVRITYVDSGGAVPDLLLFLVNVNNQVGNFTLGQALTGAGIGGGTTVTVQYQGTDPATQSSSFLLLESDDLSDLLTVGGTLTNGAGATADVVSVPRQDLEQDIEIVLREYSITQANEARAKAAQILFHGGDTITRGELQIARWPFYTIGPTTTLVRAGHLVRVTNSDASIDENMLVTKIVYDESQSLAHSRISVLSYARGKGLADTALVDMTKDIETGLWQSIGTTGGLSIGNLPYNTNIEFFATAYNEIQWTAGSIRFGNGLTYTINLGISAGLTDSTTYWVYYTEDNPVLSVTNTYSDAIASDRVLLAMVQVGVLGSGVEPTILPFTGRVLTLSAVGISANSILADKLEANLVLASNIIAGTLGAQRFQMSASGIQGYDVGDNLQVSLDSGTGMVSAGGGNVLIDSTGVRFLGNTVGTAGARFELSTFETVVLYSINDGGVGRFAISPTATAATDITSIRSFINIFEFSDTPWYVGGISGSNTVGHAIVGATGSFSPNTSGASLGLATNYWGTAYFQDIRRGSGAGGDIGSGTNYFNNVYFGYTNTRATAIASGIVFYHNNVDTASLYSSPAANFAGVDILINNGAVVTRSIEIGAIDTAGAGYRLLRVAN